MAKLSKSKTRIPAADATATNGALVPTGPWLDDAPELFRLLWEAEIQRRFKVSFFDSHSGTSGKSKIIEKYFRREFAQM